MSTEFIVDREIDERELRTDTGLRGNCGLTQRNWGLLLGTMLMVLIVMGYAAYRAGSLESALPYLMGQRFFVSESQIDLGDVLCGEEVEVTVNLINHGSEPVNIVGARKTCGCITLDTFPFVVAAHSEHVMLLKLQVPIAEIGFSHSVELYTASQQVKSFQITVNGKVVGQ